MRLAIDAMGNDRGPDPIARGVAAFLDQKAEVEVVLVGHRERVETALREAGIAKDSRLEIVHADEVVEMHEKVGVLREKRDSSIVRLVEVVREGRADAMVALGNTAAAVGATCIGLRHLQGVHRAGIAVPMPRGATSPCVVIDMGANTSAKSRHLVDYGIMASIYAESVLHIEAPRVGLLNVGEEAGKGNAMLREAFDLLREAPIRFVGNVEGGDIFGDACDVVVCDGFVGNVVLKACEGLAETLKGWLRDAFGQSAAASLGGWLAKGGLREMMRRTSYATYGGAPLLGVKGVCIIGHGRSNPEAVANALRVAADSVTVGLNGLIRERLDKARGSAAYAAASS